MDENTPLPAVDVAPAPGPSLTTLAAAMNELTLEEFSLLGHWEQAEYRTLADNILKQYAVTPR